MSDGVSSTLTDELALNRATPGTAYDSDTNSLWAEIRARLNNTSAKV